MSSHWSDAIPRPACEPALEWALTQPSLEVSWRECRRGDWMLWLLGQTGANPQRLLVKAAALCAEPAAALADKETETVCLYVVQTCIRWAEGDATDEELAKAEEAAWWAAREAPTRVAKLAARAALRASWAETARAVMDAAEAARAAAADAAREASLAYSADIVRGVFPEPPLQLHLEEVGGGDYD